MFDMIGFMFSIDCIVFLSDEFFEKNCPDTNIEVPSLILGLIADFLLMHNYMHYLHTALLIFNMRHSVSAFDFINATKKCHAIRASLKIHVHVFSKTRARWICWKYLRASQIARALL